MKLKTFSLAALFAGINSVSAFSLDFTGLDLDGSTTLSGADGDQLVITVPAFGDVAFGVAQKDAVAVVDDNNGVAAIEFDSTKTITIDFFSGSDVENVVVGFVGVDAGETPSYTEVDSRSGLVTIPVGAAGIQTVTFDRIGPKVPEPSTAILGCLGAIALLRRRR
ncbi:MAG: PEP-CTERM sorting domain-containing protein [Roseibacillus sp.]